MATKPSDSHPTHSQNLSSPVLQALQASIAAAQAIEQASIKANLEDLHKRRALAQRRLAAYKLATEGPSEQGPHTHREYLGSPDAILSMRNRLHDADGNEQALSQLAKDLRDEKERLTDLALAFYADKCDKEGVFGPC